MLITTELTVEDVGEKNSKLKEKQRTTRVVETVNFFYS